jgi:hypothetical protein
VGSFYVNFAARGPAQTAVAESLRRAKREALVSPSLHGVTFFYDRAADRQREQDIVEAAQAVSKDLGCPVWAVLNHDDDVLAYWLFESGALADEYNSCPGYFSGGSSTPEGGNSVRLCAAFEVSGKIAVVEKTLHHSKYVFAHERHLALAEALGLPWKYAGTSYGRVIACLGNKGLAKIEGIEPHRFIRVEREETSHGDDSEAQVTLHELERETEYLPFIHWVGSDKHFHHFLTRDGKRYKVKRSEWQLPPHMAALPRFGDGVALFVKVRDGKITVPDPEQLEGLSEDDLSHG